MGAHAVSRNGTRWPAVTWPAGRASCSSGHLAIIVVSIATGHWLFAVVTSLARLYGGGFQWICNITQHIGLQDNVPDFRLCCRTIQVNPFLRYLYFQMNWHTEHHMYAAVPCYNLARLHQAIEHEMPPISHGLIPAWREIFSIIAAPEGRPLVPARLRAAAAGGVMSLQEAGFRAGLFTIPWTG